MSEIDRLFGDNSRRALSSYINRIKQLEADITNLREDIKELYHDAKTEGFDVKIMRQVIRRQKLERDERDQIDMMIEVYEETLDSMKELLS